MSTRDQGADASPRDGETRTASDAQSLAERSVTRLYDGDRASQALGMRIVEVAPGRAKLTMIVRRDMLNGHEICHGGLIFSLADSAFAFACNSHNVSTVAAGATIDFLAPAREGDELVAEAVEYWRSKRTGLYEISVTTAKGQRIAVFRGRSHSLGRPVLDT